MVKDDTKDQIPLFELPASGKTIDSHPAKGSKTNKAAKGKPSPEKKPRAKKASSKLAASQGQRKEASRPPVKKGRAATATPGPVPEGDVRLTANIREDLHLKLKIVAATRRTTIGELIEELVERHL